MDLRELLKVLASVFKCRIELRQIGPRDKSKIVGGLGTCGLPLCCSTFLGEFDGVSINMAKNQMLAINIDKISGACGRLMCCLKNEQETYEELNKKLPSVGDTVTTSDGLKGTVQSVNILRQLVKVLIEVDDEKEIREFHSDELKFHPRKKKTKLSEQEIKELKALEDGEGKSKLE